MRYVIQTCDFGETTFFFKSITNVPWIHLLDRVHCGVLGTKNNSCRQHKSHQTSQIKDKMFVIAN